MHLNMLHEMMQARGFPVCMQPRKTMDSKERIILKWECKVYKSVISSGDISSMLEYLKFKNNDAYCKLVNENSSPKKAKKIQSNVDAMLLNKWENNQHTYIRNSLNK